MIVSLFLCWGINNQRDETTRQTATTTGQSSNDRPPQQPTNPGQNGQPTENNDQAAQPRGR